MMDHYTTIKDRLLEHPDIVSVTSTARPLTRLYSYSNSLWSWEGKGDDEEILLRASFVDYDFFETLSLEIKEGRGFSRDLSSDTVNAIIINEEAARIMNMASPVGMKLLSSEFENNIIGVTNDFHYRSLHTEIEPLVIMCRPQYCNYLILRIDPGKIGNGGPGMQDAMETIEGLWQEYVKDTEFTYRFIGEIIDRQYNSEKRIRQIARSFSLLAIIISCMGLFGLALSMTETRTKEIGIRKATGASSRRVMFLLTKDFTKWVIFSIIIAFPFSWWAMSSWLQNFPYRISFSTWTFILAGLLAIFISWITVIYQAWQTARKNPVESLRYE
jgi:putative ABC transport system permease protein